MNRRLFLRNAALLAAGVVAVDQLEVLERLTPRRLWSGVDLSYGLQQWDVRGTTILLTMQTYAPRLMYPAPDGWSHIRGDGQAAFGKGIFSATVL